MLIISFAEENGDRPFILTRITTDSRHPAVAPRLDLVGVFSRTELAELKSAILKTLRAH